MAGRLTARSAADRRAYHEVLSLSVIVAIAIHGLALVGDGVLHPSLLDLTVPFAWSYMRVATTLDILAGRALMLPRRFRPRRRHTRPGKHPDRPFGSATEGQASWRRSGAAVGVTRAFSGRLSKPAPVVVFGSGPSSVARRAH